MNKKKRTRPDDLYEEWEDACFRYPRLHPMVLDVRHDVRSCYLSRDKALSILQRHFWKEKHYEDDRKRQPHSFPTSSSSSTSTSPKSVAGPFDLISVKRPDSSALHTLYSLKACLMCARRFSNPSDFAAHLDTHAQENLKKLYMKDKPISQSRQWNISVHHWIDPTAADREEALAAPPREEEGEGEKSKLTKEKPLATWVEADSVSTSKCMVCDDTFPEEWEDECDAWVYRHVCRVQNNQLVHQKCMS